MPTPLVTALVDTYKRERYIEQALDSQRFPFWLPGRLCFLPFHGLGQLGQSPASELNIVNSVNWLMG
jgi:hypothetical protein